MPENTKYQYILEKFFHISFDIYYKTTRQLSCLWSSHTLSHRFTNELFFTLNSKQSESIKHCRPELLLLLGNIF